MWLSSSTVPYPFKHRIQEIKNNIQNYRTTGFPPPPPPQGWIGRVDNSHNTQLYSLKGQAERPFLSTQERRIISHWGQSLHCPEAVMHQTAGRVNQSVLPPRERRLTHASLCSKRCFMLWNKLYTGHSTGIWSSIPKVSMSQWYKPMETQGKNACKLDFFFFNWMISVITQNLFKQSVWMNWSGTMTFTHHYAQC